MLKYRYIILSIVYLIFCVIDCCYSNIPIVNAIDTGYFTPTDILMSLHDSANGYNGLMELLVVYTFPVLLGIYFVADKETSYCIVRYDTRTRYKRNENKKVLTLALIFSGIHQMIDVIFAMLNFEVSFLMETSFIRYTILFGIIMFLFYLETGFLYQIIHDLLKIDLLALIATFIVNFVQYLLIRYGITNFWIPGEDVLVAFEYFRGKIDLTVVIMTIFRCILILGCFYLFGQIVFEEKDIMKHEK